MRRLVSDVCLFVLLPLWLLTVGTVHAQFNSFPPGAFLGHGARDASGGGPPAYAGPLDVVATPTWWHGLRAPSLALAGNKAINACNPGDAACADFSTNATTGQLTISTVGGVSCSESISSGTYSGVTGAVVLTTSLSASLSSGNLFALSVLTGTGSVASLSGVWTATTGTTGTTVNFTAPTGLTLTITGGTVSVCTINTFYDGSQGGFTGNCGGACNLVQSTIADRAVLIVGCINSLPCAGFSGTNTSYNTIGNLGTTIPQPYTISIVAERTANFTTTQTIISVAPFTIQTAFQSSANTVVIFANNLGPTATASDSHFHSLQFGFADATQSFIYVDGTNNNVSLGSTLGESAMIGAGTYMTGNPLTGYFVEDGSWPIAFSSGQKSNMNSNQTSYWGPF